MGTHDWRNIDFGALLKSDIMRGLIVTTIGLICSAAGYAAPDDLSMQVTNILQAVGPLVSALGVAYSSFHRVTAQPETVAVIVPKKPGRNAGIQK